MRIELIPRDLALFQLAIAYSTLFRYQAKAEVATREQAGTS